ncbi:MAG: S-layer homology domain-containing protein, partial [Bacilli bacterium]
MKKNLSKLLASSLVVSSLVTPVAVLAEESAATSFPDVNATDWYATWVQQAKDNGLMNGNPDGNFDPGGELTRAQLAAIMAQTLGLEENA